MTETTEVRENFQIPAANLGHLQAKLEKLNKRAIKIGCPLIILTEGELFQRSILITTEDGAEVRRNVTYVNITVSGQTPRINGFEFIATLQHLGEDGNVIRAVPGCEVTIPVSYRAAKPTCFHCGVLRRRNDTFLLREVATGTIKQIGRNCLQDFLRTTSPEHLAQMAEHLCDAVSMAHDAEGEGFGGGSKGGPIYFAEFMSHVCAVVRAVGAFVSRTKAKNTDGAKSTVTIAQTVMFARGKELSDLRKEWPEVFPTEADVEQAKTLIAWTRENVPAMLAKDESNDYLYNVSVAIKRDYLDERLLGIAGSIISIWKREMERAAAKANEQKSTQVSQFIGAVGERIKALPVTLLSSFSKEKDWGTLIITKLITDGGSVATQFSGVALHNADGSLVENGQRIFVNATIKEHSLYQGSKQTIFSRCTVISAEAAAEVQAKAAKKAARDAKKAERASKAVAAEGTAAAEATA